MPMDGKTQTCGFLDQMSTEQLYDLIRTDFESSEEGNTDLTIRILEVIKERERKEHPENSTDVKKAWDDFQKYFNTPDGTGRSLYPMEDFDLMTADRKPKKPSKSAFGRLAKRLLPVAAVVAVAFSSMVAAQAFGFDVFGALARWTSETFHFATETLEETTNSETEALYQTVQEAFDRCGITIPAPSWYPKGTVLDKDIDVLESLEDTAITCNFTCGGNSFVIVVQQYHESNRVPAYTFEKDIIDAEEYPSNGRLFYIVSNLQESYAVYSDEQIVILISGNLPLEFLKQIIDSIGE